MNAAPNLASAMRAVVTMSRMDPLDLLFAQASELANDVATSGYPFILAVDFAYGVAVTAGLCETFGDDAVQAVLARAFMRVPRGDE